jgi:hypothetical protein
MDSPEERVHIFDDADVDPASNYDECTLELDADASESGSGAGVEELASSDSIEVCCCFLLHYCTLLATLLAS